jgi:molybdate transport system permease protein
MSEDFSVVAFTLEVALLSTLVILPFGVLAGWGLARWRGATSWLRPLVETALVLPLVLPPTAVGLLLLQLLRPRGAIGRLLAALSVDVAFTWKAVVVATAVMSFPLLVRTARAAFEEVDPALVGVARTLGCTSLQAFRRVTMPLAWRGVLAGSLLAFSRALGEFGATVLVAGYAPEGRQTIALAIFQRTETRRDGDALRLVAIVVVIAFVAIWATEILGRRRTRRLRDERS